MGFVRTHSGELISLIDISRLYQVEHDTGGHTVVAVLRADASLIRLARDYTIETLSRQLAPGGTGR